jgi:hypothetical protein
LVGTLDFDPVKTVFGNGETETYDLADRIRWYLFAVFGRWYHWCGYDMRGAYVGD